MAIIVVILLAATFIPGLSADAQSTRELNVHLLLVGLQTFKADVNTKTCVPFPDSKQPATITIGASTAKLPVGAYQTPAESVVGKRTCALSIQLNVPVRSTYTIDIAGYRIGKFTDLEFRKLDNSLVLAVQRDARANTVTLLNPDGKAPMSISPPPTSVSKPIPTPTLEPTPTIAAGSIKGTDTYRIVGTFELLGADGDDFTSFGEYGCVGLGGYSDISIGKQVIIRNQSGDIIATSKFEPDPTASSRDCRFLFVAEVPDATFYSFEIGHRGELAYSKQEMEANDWRVEFSLG